MALSPEVTCFYHKDTGTDCYVVACPNTKVCAVIDPVLDYDQVAHKTAVTHANQVLAFIDEKQYQLAYIIETHVHADHLTGAQILKSKWPQAKTVIGFNVVTVQRTFAQFLNLHDLPCDGSQFDKLMHDGEEFTLGDLPCKAMWTPGHTPACMNYIIGDAIFSGDTIFMPDFGTARCDFPGGSASDLFDSIQKIYRLQGNYRLFVGHDYGLESRPPAWETTLDTLRTSNKQVTQTTTKDQFVTWRTNRDKTLALPKLIMQSLQVNLRNGKLPEPEENGVSYFKLPISAL